MVVMFPDAYKGLCPLMHCCFISFAVEQLRFLALIGSFCSFGMVFLVVSGRETQVAEYVPDFCTFSPSELCV